VIPERRKWEEEGKGGREEVDGTPSPTSGCRPLVHHSDHPDMVVVEAAVPDSTLADACEASLHHL